MDGHTGIIAVSGAGGEGQDMVAALWMNPGLDQGILQQLIKSHSHIREPPVFFLFAGVLGGRFCGVPAGIGGSGSDRDGAVPYPVGLSSTVNIK